MIQPSRASERGRGWGVHHWHCCARRPALRAPWRTAAGGFFHIPPRPDYNNDYLRLLLLQLRRLTLLLLSAILFRVLLGTGIVAACRNKRGWVVLPGPAIQQAGPVTATGTAPLRQNDQGVASCTTHIVGGVGYSAQHVTSHGCCMRYAMLTNVAP